MIGRDAGELAGLGANGIKVVSDVAPLLKGADGLIEFTIPAATVALAEPPRPPASCTSSAPPAIRPRRKR